MYLQLGKSGQIVTVVLAIAFILALILLLAP